MNQKLNIVRIKPHTEEWFEFRGTGIGGSEVAASLRMSRWLSQTRVYHDKVGDVLRPRINNRKMVMGRHIEDFIANLWQYYDGSDDGWVDNLDEGKVFRRCRKLNGFAVNPDYPWLYASVDRLINKGGMNMLDMESLSDEGILECKNTEFMASKNWENEIPDEYFLQVQQYMLIFDVKYAEIALFVNGNNLRVLPLRRDDGICERVVNMTRDFWYDRVIPAKEAYKLYLDYFNKGMIDKAEEQMSIIQDLEPEPDDTRDYEDFKKDGLVSEVEKVRGGVKLYSFLKNDKMYTAMEKEIKSRKQYIKNVALNFMDKNKCTVVDFDSLGMLDNTKKWNNKIKEKPSDEFVREQLDKITLNF